jgi:hypothetical protein
VTGNSGITVAVNVTESVRSSAVAVSPTFQPGWILVILTVTGPV